jgi:hypothetical protein
MSRAGNGLCILSGIIQTSHETSPKLFNNFPSCMSRMSWFRITHKQCSRELQDKRRYSHLGQAVNRHSKPKYRKTCLPIRVYTIIFYPMQPYTPQLLRSKSRSRFYQEILSSYASQAFFLYRSASLTGSPALIMPLPTMMISLPIKPMILPGVLYC